MITTQTQMSENACPSCGATTESGHFCTACGRIQPISQGSDYFGFLGLPIRLRLDEVELEKSFYALSRQFHPDYFMNSSAEEQKASIDRSSMLNDAYRTLRDRISRAKYLLSLYGYKEAEKKAPADLLEEVFELNMHIEELKAAKKIADEDEVAEARSALKETLQGLDQKLEKIDNRLLELFDEWDRVAVEAASEEQKKQVLDRMSELLSHRSYIHNLVRDINEEL